MDPVSPQRGALLRAPTLDLTLPEALDGQRQEEDSEGGEDNEDGEDSDVDSNADSDVDSDGEEDERSKEEEVFRSEARKAVFMEIKRREEGPESLRWPEAQDKLKERARELVQGLKSWRDLKPRRVQALVSCKGKSSDETQLSFEPGEVMTEVRPAVWMLTRMQARWLEGTLDGRVGLIYGEDVKYLD